MKLEECTKDELIYIIKKVTEGHFAAHFKVQSTLAELKFRRTDRLIKEADNWNVIASDCRIRYAELLKPYQHCKIADIPEHILQEADRCLKDARRADREWGLCMKRLGD